MRLLSNASDSNNNVWRSQKFDFNAKENDHFTLTCYYSIELRVCIEGCWAAKKFDIKALRNHDNNTQGKTWSMNLRVGDSARYIPRCFTSQYIISTTTVCIHLPFGDSCVLYLPCSTGTCVWDHCLDMVPCTRGTDLLGEGHQALLVYSSSNILSTYEICVFSA